MLYSEKRLNDVKKTDIIANFCDEKIFPQLPYRIARNKDRRLQLKGVDLIWEGAYIDEKFATNYINRNLRTFAFELSSLNNKNECGWFLEGDYMLTTSYLLGFLEGDINKKELTRVEMIMVNKKTIWNYLNKKAFPKNIVSEIRYGQRTPDKVANTGAETYFINIPGIKLIHSTQLQESPINIVISKEILKKLATETYEYRNNKTEITKKYKKS